MADANNPATPNTCNAGGGPPPPSPPLARVPSADAPEEKYEGLDNPSIVVSADAPLLRVPVLSLRPTQIAVGKYSVGVKAAKVAKKRARGAAALDDWLRRHPIPCVRGPPDGADTAAAGAAAATGGGGDGGRSAEEQKEEEEAPLYLIDHHHLAAALHSLGVGECYAAVVRDYSRQQGQEEGEQKKEQEEQKKDQQGQEEQQHHNRGAKARFWRAMRRDGCLWPHDEHGREVGWEDLPARLPASVAGLRDDPYRSLAGLVRRAGGYEKSARPFAEFVWANHLRPRVPLALAAAKAAAASEAPSLLVSFAALGGEGGGQGEAPIDVSVLVPLALEHASHRDAEGLPGFTPGGGGAAAAAQ